MIRDLYSFLDEYFEGLTLAPPLFYSWSNSIRFEISNPLFPNDSKESWDQTFQRSISLFRKVFEERDVNLLVTDVLTTSDNHFLRRKPLNVYKKYIKDKNKLNQLQYQYFFKDEEDRTVIHRFVLPCKRDEIRYVQLLKGICYEDFAHPSTILKNNQESGYEIYFINLTKKIIFHLYDDRGCDVLASNKEMIRYLYEELNSWILDYDRKKIDTLFK
ncbi:DUF3885 domain-containing protein [Bacillus sp. AFS037270]|uniref:DUF3885 domain-containing protein n=1 Tax=Bacillus sp. AFS037270 TaxID=2033499 RepID=UPI000BFBA500|nr:DUF3885 domain-containing protein [Bacillus sp. AFS037270]PGV53450.1 hypothetical protein COD92_07645 [Bacillus sp. AFS037270]